MLTGRVIGPPKDTLGGAGKYVQSLVRGSGEPVIRAAMMQAMRHHGRAIRAWSDSEGGAQTRTENDQGRGGGAFQFRYARRGRPHSNSMQPAISKPMNGRLPKLALTRMPGLRRKRRPGISVKLSALHPRYEAVNEVRVMAELYPRVLVLCEAAAKANINLCLDAEEADRLVLSLKIFEALAREPSLKDWSGLGLAVQAYQKRAREVIDRLTVLAHQTGQRFMVRLVKGAYWDSEIKYAQEGGYPNFPFFTTKQGTDLNFIACAKALLESSPTLYPQFATHNAHSFAVIELIADEAWCHGL